MSKTEKSKATGSLQISLSKAYDFDGAKADYLTMREPTVADQLATDDMQGGEVAKEISMFANLCQVTPDQIKALTLRDYKKVQAAFLDLTN